VQFGHCCGKNERRKEKLFVEEDNECGCCEREIPRKSSKKSAILFSFDVLLTVHLSVILVINQLDKQNLVL